MISNQILQNTIDGLKDITRIDMCVFDTEGKCAPDRFARPYFIIRIEDKSKRNGLTFCNIIFAGAVAACAAFCKAVYIPLFEKLPYILLAPLNRIAYESGIYIVIFIHVYIVPAHIENIVHSIRIIEPAADIESAV